LKEHAGVSENNEQYRARRRRAVRMALVLAGVVSLIYLGFIMKGVLNAL
jgi:hypothetical protein